MFKQDHSLTTVNTVLPARAAHVVARELTSDKDTNALSWKARGTLLQEHWLKRWLPAISPEKTMLQMIVPDSAVDQIVNTVVHVGKLNYQATGAVISTPHDHAFLGPEFPAWPGEETAHGDSHKLSSDLCLIFCIVNHAYSEKMSKAAVNVGAHGPIVYYCEGRGLRDRLGWLRITKEHEKEVLMVIADRSEGEQIFNAMAKAGELHLPGRGFMFQVAIDKGMFNIPSRVTNLHHDASMQQIINAIDHIQGHTHWRDQSVFEVGQGRGAGIELVPEMQDQTAKTCLTTIVRRSQMQTMMDLLLDHGVPGLNFSFAKFIDVEEDDGNAHISEEYAVIRSITDESLCQTVCAAIEGNAETLGLHDLCATVDAVDRIATYVPGHIDFRNNDAA